MRHLRWILALTLTVTVLCIAQTGDAPLPFPTLVDGIQIGSDGDDFASAGAMDADGNIYLTGSVGGSLQG